jgi:hypothetical protein
VMQMRVRAFCGSFVIFLLQAIINTEAKLPMIYQYVVTLKRNNDKYIDTFSILLCTISILAFVFEQIETKKINFFSLIASITLAAGIARNIYLKKFEKKTVRYRYLLFIAGVFWIMMPYLQWFSIPFFLLSFLEYQAKYPLEVGFNNQEITINNLFKKKFKWSDFSNIILKDGILTLDFKNNTLFQKEAIDDDEAEADEDEFNEYCKEQLARAMNE